MIWKWLRKQITKLMDMKPIDNVDIAPREAAKTADGVERPAIPPPTPGHNRQVFHIIVHHSLSNWGTGAVVINWHTDPVPRGNGWKTPGYHVVICGEYPDYYSWSNQRPVREMAGRIDRIVPESRISNGAKGLNRHALHACMIGDFDRYVPGAIQYSSLIDVLTDWCYQYQLPVNKIYGHGEAQVKLLRKSVGKSCPGKMIDTNKLRDDVREALKIKYKIKINREV